MKQAITQSKQQQILPKELVPIVAEVNKHGFYSAKLNEFILEASNRDEIVYLVYLIAKEANLKVSFNFKLGLCVFEADGV